MPVETIINNKMSFHSFSSLCQTDGCEGSTVYGLKITWCDDTIFQVNDISSNEIDVLRLITILKEDSFPIEQLEYIIEDFVESLYM